MGKAVKMVGSNGFDRDAVADLLAASTPPAGMAAAPVAPARGPMQMRDNWVVEAGGTRRLDGAHWRDMCQLEVMVAQAAQRHAARGGDEAFVPPFTPGQIAVARSYRDLVEWREGSAMKCSSLEAGRGSGGDRSGLFIDTFIGHGEWLGQLRQRIGADIILTVRRNMDRGNARRAISARIAVDAVVLQGLDLSAILTRHGWAADGKNRKALRLGICDALDRMQGYRDSGA